MEVKNRMKNVINIMNRTIGTEAIVNTMGFNCDAISTDREWRETRTTIKTESNYKSS